MISIESGAFERIVENLHDGLYFVDKNRVITYWNKAAERITGFSADEVVGRACHESILTHIDEAGNCLCLEGCPLKATIEDKCPRSTRVFLHHKDGHRVPVSVRATVLTDENGEVIGGVEVFTDVSSLEANEHRVKELEKLALLDNLTQLANRNYIEKELESRFQEKDRMGVPFGILVIDIDYFKNFNDTYGHDVGDKVLKYVANTLVGNARPFDLYGRWGGEEFIGIMRNVSIKELEAISERVRTLVENAYIVHNDEKLHVTVSIGTTAARVDDDAKSLFKRADTLMYQSKNEGRNRVTAA